MKTLIWSIIIIFFFGSLRSYSQDNEKIFFSAKVIAAGGDFENVSSTEQELLEEIKFNECEILESKGFNNNVIFVLVRRRFRGLLKHFLMVQIADSLKSFSSTNISMLLDRSINDSLKKYYNFSDSISNSDLEKKLYSKSNYYSFASSHLDLILAYDKLKHKFFRIRGFMENDRSQFIKTVLLGELLENEFAEYVQKMKHWKHYYENSLLPSYIENNLYVKGIPFAQLFK